MNGKALYRRAQGYKQVGKYQKAIEDLEILNQLEPENMACKKDLDQMKAILDEKNKKFISRKSKN